MNTPPPLNERSSDGPDPCDPYKLLQTLNHSPLKVHKSGSFLNVDMYRSQGGDNHLVVLSRRQWPNTPSLTEFRGFSLSKSLVGLRVLFSSVVH